MAGGERREREEPGARDDGDVQVRCATDRDARKAHGCGAEDRRSRRLAMKSHGVTRSSGQGAGAVAAIAARRNLLAAPDSNSIGASPTSTMASEGSAASDRRSSRAN